MIILPLIVIAAIAVSVRYVIADRTSKRLYDNTLHAVALAISRDIVLSEGDILAKDLLDSLVGVLGDPIYYRVVGPDGRFIAGYFREPIADRPVREVSNDPLFYDATYYDEPVRALVFREYIVEPTFGGWVTVQVWQTVRQRSALSFRLVEISGYMMAIIIVTAGLVVWFGINLGLEPLMSLREAIALRSPDDLSPIRRPVPNEVSNLVAAMNALFTRLSKAFAERDAFISDAAHQLRNPIAGILAQAEAAENAPDHDELRSRVGQVGEAARRTSRLTTQLLSLERARGQASSQRKSELNLTQIAENALARFAPEALKRGVSVSFETRGERVPLRGDPILINEAIENLIDNALRYGIRDKGELYVSLSFEKKYAKLTVRDYGPGIPERSRDQIFNRFFRASEDGIDGCGLGLAIVKEIAENHNGEVRLADTEKGACFELILPALWNSESTAKS